MKTLVLKTTETCANENVRGLNEFRFKLVSKNTTDTIKVRPVQNDGTYKGRIQYRILSGNGYFQNQGTSYDIKNYVSVTVPSGECIVQIKNFDLMTDVMGTSSTTFFARDNASGSPIAVISMKDLKYKTFLKQIALFGDSYIDKAAGYIEDCEDISDFANFTELTYLMAQPYTSNTIRGSLSSLRNLKKLTKFYMTTWNKKFSSDFYYGIDDLISMTALTKCRIDGGTFIGGDVYELLNNKSYIMFSFQALHNKTQDISCSYVSGTSSIPTTTLKTLDLFYTSTVHGVTIGTAKTILTLIKDGINANKITLDTNATVKLGTTTAPDTELETLKSQVEALGVTVVM